MRALAFLFVIVISLVSLSAQTVKFEEYFADKTLRIDYVRSGNTLEQEIEINKISQYDKWAGSKTNLIYPFDFGHFRIRVLDQKTDKLIFSKNFDSLFYEYCLTKMAQEGKKASFEEVQLVPFPLQPVKVCFDKRDELNQFSETFSLIVDPVEIKKGEISESEVFKISENGDCENRFDLTFLSEAYTENEKEKFLKDVNKNIEILFKQEPFKKLRQKINISAVFTSSNENGADDPLKEINRDTKFGSTFNGLGDPRYLILTDIFEVYNVILKQPTDFFIIVCNTDKFGANGIFNYFTLISNTERMPEMVLTHEMGHSVGGLADEYYHTMNFAHGTIYPQHIEPVEANITTLTNIKDVKWKKYLSPGTEIPTDWGKEKFDSLTDYGNQLYAERNQKLEGLTDKGKIAEIKNQYRDIFRKLQFEMQDFIENHPLKNKIGVYEGAGHTQTGVYRPSINSIMHYGDHFDIVSEKIMEEIIELYIGKN